MKRKDQKVVAFVQARMGSTRLPGKHLLSLLDEPMLSRLFERLKGAKTLDQIVLATTTEPKDDCLAELAVANKIPFFRGSSENVLERFYQASRLFPGEIIVRITADCPLIDPALVDKTVDYFRTHRFDYVSNTQSYPRGMDTEVFSRASFEKVYNSAKTPAEKEHVTPFYYRHPELFKLGSLPKQTIPPYRLTVDTQEDFLLVSHIYEALYPQNPHFSLQDIYTVLDTHPDWHLINAHIAQKPVGE